MSEARIFQIRVTVEIEEDGREVVRQEWSGAVQQPSWPSYISDDERDDVVIAQLVEKVVRSLATDIRGRLR